MFSWDMEFFLLLRLYHSQIVEENSTFPDIVCSVNSRYAKVWLNGTE